MPPLGGTPRAVPRAPRFAARRRRARARRGWRGWPLSPPAQVDEDRRGRPARERLDPQRTQPANRSSTRAPSTDAPSTLNSASRTRSDVGLVASPGGAPSRRPRYAPATTLTASTGRGGFHRTLLRGAETDPPPSCRQRMKPCFAVVAALADDGAFTTFAYQHARWAPPARRLHRTLRELFEEVVVGGTVWANLPPAVVYHCRRPVRQPLVEEPGMSRPARHPSSVRPLNLPQPARS